MENTDRILAALDVIPVNQLIRDDWIKIGMALKYEGFDWSVWDQWSQNDTRYHEGECEQKWKGFKGSNKPVTGATIVKMGIERGMKWSYGDFESYGWDAEISIEEPEQSQKPNERQMVVDYLRALFKPDEYVSYVTESYQGKDGEFHPGKGNFERKCKELISEIEKYGVGGALGDWNEDVGAWIRFNPVDGTGIADTNITRWDYALVESDSMSLGEQEAAYRKLELPIAAMVYSGGKSIHAIVHVDAKNADEYAERVKILYEYMRDHGFDMDQQNKNPSRLSRLPGATRNGKIQKLIATNCGAKSWIEWRERIEEVDNPLPDIENLADVYENPPPLPDERIEGILRQGHKLLISGSSKAGKSFLLIELAIAIAEGTKWLGFQCKQGKVLYINLEIDKPSFINRMLNAYKALGLPPKNVKNIGMWNLRGNAIPLDKLAPRLIRRIKNQGYDVVIFDPIYKIITGDENKASDMGAFCNQFDKVCNEAAVCSVYCHHHSKGGQGFKKAIDRASGSGVFARDPDAILDVIELDLRYDDDGNSSFVNKYGEGSVWKLECSLREFKNPDPVFFRFKYPIHELLVGDELEDSKKLYASGDKKNNLKVNPTEETQMAKIKDAYEEFEFFGAAVIRVRDIAERTGMSPRTVRDHIKNMSEFNNDNGVITRTT